MDPEDRRQGQGRCGRGRCAHAKNAGTVESQGLRGSREDGGFDSEDDGPQEWVRNNLPQLTLSTPRSGTTAVPTQERGNEGFRA